MPSSRRCSRQSTTSSSCSTPRVATSRSLPPIHRCCIARPPNCSASPSTQPVLGYGATENVGRSAFELVHPDDRADALELFGELMQRPGHLVKTELRALHKDGSWRRLEAVGVNRLDDPAIRAIVVT